jgi:hypothetical protein
MDQSAISEALTRIETALRRVDAASRHTVALRGRHEQLKASVRKSLDEIDAVIAQREI